MAFDDNNRELSLGELENANTDRSTNPAVMVRGMMTRTSAGSWVYLGSDANFLRISSIGGSGGLSANQSISARLLEGTAFVGDVSALSPDAGLFRVSNIGGGSGISSNQSLSALGLEGTAHIGSVSAVSPDAGLFHVSSFVDSGSVSAMQGAAGNLRMSAFSNDGGLLRVSAITALSANQQISATLLAGTATIGAIDSGSISAKSGDGNQLHVSAVQGDAGLLHVSGFTSTATNFPVSSTQGDANLLHVSSYFGVDTTGQWSVGFLSNLSSSGNIKATAGTVYGYYAWNTDTKPQYIRLTNTSGAISVGTDTPIVRIMLPPSAAANVGFPGGLKGFTNGIGAYAVSATAEGATTPAATSAVGITVFYN